ncbi:MAG TPA: hypothetical protein VGH00_01055, partial [Chthoniobacterales bacterium]
APWVGLHGEDAWIKNARHANRFARILADKLVAATGIEPVFPCEANAVFVRLDEQLVTKLHERGWRFYKFLEPDIYRLMCAWSTTEKQIDEFIGDLTKCLAAKKNGG